MNATRREPRLALLAAFLITAFSAAVYPATAANPGEQIVYQQDFERDTGGWSVRSSSMHLSLDGIPAHGGKHALNVTGRTATWNGPIRDLTNQFRPGHSYRIDFWARFDEGPDNQMLNVSFQKSVDGAGDSFETIGGGMMLKGQWVQISVETSIPKDKTVSARQLYFETPWKPNESLKPADLISFAIDDIVITRLPDPAPLAAQTDIPAFKDFFPKDMHIGTAITAVNFDPKNPHNSLMRHFNTFVLGNEMKQDATEPREGQFKFEVADQLVKYAAANPGTALRGHTLLWHQQVPSWLFQDPSDPSKPASKELLLKRIENHIKTLVGRYKGKFYSWDVVNECIGEDGELRNSPYLKIVGSDEFIEKAFRWAHEADPDARLVLNDYNTEYGGAKQEGFYREVKSLLDRGVPIGAVGFQCHLASNRPQVSDIRDAIERFSALGIDVQVTELDISIYADSSEQKKKATSDMLMEQAQRYAALFRMFREEHAAGRLSTVLIWGISDDETWLNNFPVMGRTDYPLLFGKDIQAKPSYWAVVDPSKLPVYTKKSEALSTAAKPENPSDQAWSLVTEKPITDRQGTVFGGYKVLWTPDALHVLVHVLDKDPTPSDAVTLYFDPKDEKSAAISPAVSILTIGRDKAASTDESGYTVQASLPFPNPARAFTKVGFDVKIRNGNTAVAWNDFTLSQDKASDKYGELALKPMPAVALVNKGTPKFEAAAGPAWANAVSLPIEAESQGFAEKGSTVKLLWDENYLYALFEIKDKALSDKSPNAFEQSSVELFLDQNNGKTDFYESDDGQYRVNFKNAASFNGGKKDSFKSVTRIFLGGYRVMMEVPLYMMEGKEGRLLGFDAQINFADASGSRTAIRNWVDTSNEGYRNTSGWGVLKLVP